MDALFKERGDAPEKKSGYRLTTSRDESRLIGKGDLWTG